MAIGSEPAGLVVEVTEIIVHEAREPEMVIDLPNVDQLSGEDLAKIDLPAVEVEAINRVGFQLLFAAEFPLA